MQMLKPISSLFLFSFMAVQTTFAQNSNPPFEGNIAYQDIVKTKVSGGVTYRSTKLFFNFDLSATLDFSRPISSICFNTR